VLGVVLGLFFITLLILAFILYRRRRMLGISGTATQSEVGTMVEHRRRTLRWLYSTPLVEAKAPTITTDETPGPMTPEPESEFQGSYAQEMSDDTQLHEMDDTSPPAELNGLGFVHFSGSNNDYQSSRSQIAHSPWGASNVSRTSIVSGTSRHRPSISPTSPTRADSLTLNETGIGRTRIGSDLSSVTESERNHMRGISETSVSVDGSEVYPTPGERSSPIPMAGYQRPGVVSPVTPPEVVGEGEGDYVGVHGTIGSADGRRRSNFSEKLDE